MTAHGETIRPLDATTATENQAQQRWRPDWRRHLAGKGVDGEDPPKAADGNGEANGGGGKACAAAPWPTQQKVKDLAEELDRIYADCQAMEKLSERLETATEEWARKTVIQEAQRVIERFEIRGGRNGIKDGRLGKLWDACCPESWWPEDSDTPRL